MKRRIVSMWIVCAILVCLVPNAGAVGYQAVNTTSGLTGTLEAVIGQAAAGDTVEIVNDVVLTAQLKITVRITLTTDGAPRTIAGPTVTGATPLLNVTADAAGTVIRGSGETGRLTIDGSSESGVVRQRALLYLQGAGCAMEYVTLENSHCSYNGAGLYTNAAGQELRCVTFANCVTTGNGGAVYMTSAGGVSLEECTVNGCTAAAGGAVYSAANSAGAAGQITACDTVFRGNTATDGNGGAVYGSGSAAGGASRLIFNRCAFIENSASGRGGAVYVAALSALCATHTGFKDNGQGSAAYAAGADVTAGTTGNPYITLSGNCFSASAQTAIYCMDSNSAAVSFAAENRFDCPGVADPGGNAVYNADHKLYYTKLDTAVTYAFPDETLRLIDDVTLTSRLTIQKALTIETDGVADRTIRAGRAINSHLIYIRGAEDVAGAYTVTLRGGVGSRLILDARQNAAGAAVFVAYADAVLRCVDVVNGSSTSGSHAGGLYVTQGTVNGEQVLVENNQTDSVTNIGGAIHITATGSLYLHRSAVQNNVALNEMPAGGDGHSIIRANGSFSAIDCTFSGNQAAGYVISTATDAAGYVRLIRNCVFDTGEKTAVDVSNTTHWDLLGNIYADSARTEGSATLLDTLPSMAEIEAAASGVWYTEGSAYNGYSAGEIATDAKTSEEVTFRLPDGDTVNRFCESYSAALLRAGYGNTATQIIGSNTFSTFVKGQTAVTVMATPGSATLRVLADYGAARQTSVPAAGSVTPTVTMLGVGDEAQDLGYGMCFLYHLSNDHFLVVDGGYNSAEDTAQLYEKMASLVEGNRIVIDAWILTHPHADHVGTFVRFARTYSGSVTLGSIVFNFPHYNSYLETAGEPQNTSYTQQVHQTIQTYYSSVPIYKPHPGTVLEFGGARLTFYYTYELAAPNNLWYFNNSSLVFTVEINGRRCMMLGDCAGASTELILADYTVEDLTCDAVQMGHHGHYNNMVQTDFYRAVMGDTGEGATLTDNGSVRLAFWPGCDMFAYTNAANNQTAARNAAAPGNAYLIAQENVEIVVAGDHNAHPMGFTWQILPSGLRAPGAAAVRGISYASLEEALAHTAAGGTVTLLSDVSINGLTFERNVTIDAAEPFVLAGTAAVAAGVTVTMGEAVSGGRFLLGDEATAVTGKAYDGCSLYRTTLVAPGTRCLMELPADVCAVNENTLIGYNSLSGALAGAAAGDALVLVRDVTLTEPLLVDKAVTVSTDGSARTVTVAVGDDAEGSPIVLASDAVLRGTGEEGRLIVDGQRLARQAALISVTGAPSLEYVTVRHGSNGQTTAAMQGGAMLLSGNEAAVRAVSCIFEENAAAQGGAICLRAGAAGDLRDCAFVSNTARDKGGAIYAGANTAITLTNCTLHSNEAQGQYGGGAVYVATNGAVEMAGGTVSGNRSTTEGYDRSGGAVWVAQSNRETCGFFKATGTLFAGNSTGSTAAYSGAAIFAHGVCELDGCTFRDNTGSPNAVGFGVEQTGYTCRGSAVDRSITNCLFYTSRENAVFETGHTVARACNIYVDPLAAVSAALGSDLSLHFYVTADEADARMQFEWGQSDAPRSSVAALDTSGGRYSVSVPAKEMYDPITATLRVGENEWSCRYAVADYLRALAVREPAYSDIAEAALAYGAAARDYFGYGEAVAAPALPAVKREEIAAHYTGSGETADDSIRFYGISVLAKSRLVLRLYFYSPDGAPDVTVDGVRRAAAQAAAEYWYVDVEETARCLGGYHTVAVSDTGMQGFRIGVNDYIRRTLAQEAYGIGHAKLADLCRALYLYGAAAAMIE